ncbi:hypothetical protein ABTQ07_23145, partial [Acinetobacter baumannii]
MGAVESGKNALMHGALRRIGMGCLTVAAQVGDAAPPDVPGLRAVKLAPPPAPGAPAASPAT